MPKATCSVANCDDSAIAIGFCSKHYQRKRKHGDPLAGNPSPQPVRDHPDGTRTCNSCDVRKPIDEYDTDASATQGRRSHCKQCRSARMKEWYAENQERQRNRQRERYANNVEAIRIQDMERYERHRDKRIALATQQSHKRKHRLLSRDYDPTVTRDALRERMGDQCVYCDTTMDFDSYTPQTRPPDLATLEHLIPVSKGGTHTWDNVVLACLSCNIRKNASDLDDWLVGNVSPGL